MFLFLVAAAVAVVVAVVADGVVVAVAADADGVAWAECFRRDHRQLWEMPTVRAGSVAEEARAAGHLRLCLF